MKRNILLLLIPTFLILSGCSDILRVQEFLKKQSPRSEYKQALLRAGLENAKIVRDWDNAGEEVFKNPVSMERSFSRQGTFIPFDPNAFGYRINVLHGQRITVITNCKDDSIKVFVDIFEIMDDTSKAPKLFMSGTQADTLSHIFDSDRIILLRIQPELFADSDYAVSVSIGGSIYFPVEGVDTRAIHSFFGDPRDGGKRDHHGVDIFAPRGTSVVAVRDGWITRVRTGGRGGKHIWLRAGSYSFYYAHLDSQFVQNGQRVRMGDTLGIVGNTGNARTTPPHLHFGIYRYGPIDPLPFL